MKRQILDINFWNTKRELIKKSYGYDNNWKDVIERFESRIEDFYFKPINRVKDPNELKGEGFTILTIQCALIEMFAAFKYGKIHKYNKRGALPEYEYKSADDCFIRFLHTEEIFTNHFFKIVNGAKKVNQPFSAKDFYNKVRCGLMHEARTKEEWIINAKKEYSGNEIIFLTRKANTNKISIDRNILNKQLKGYFQAYILELKSDKGNALRRLLARKLDHLYDIPPDANNFDWWKDK